MEAKENKVICPDCGSEILTDENTAVGDILECTECGTEVEVLSLNPIKYSELIEQK